MSSQDRTSIISDREIDALNMKRAAVLKMKFELYDKIVQARSECEKKLAGLSSKNEANPVGDANPPVIQNPATASIQPGPLAALAGSNSIGSAGTNVNTAINVVNIPSMQGAGLTGNAYIRHPASNHSAWNNPYVHVPSGYHQGAPAAHPPTQQQLVGGLDVSSGAPPSTGAISSNQPTASSGLTQPPQNSSGMTLGSTVPSNPTSSVASGQHPNSVLYSIPSSTTTASMQMPSHGMLSHHSQQVHSHSHLPGHATSNAPPISNSSQSLHINTSGSAGNQQGVLGMHHSLLPPEVFVPGSSPMAGPLLGHMPSSGSSSSPRYNPLVSTQVTQHLSGNMSPNMQHMQMSILQSNSSGNSSQPLSNSSTGQSMTRSNSGSIRTTGTSGQMILQQRMSASRPSSPFGEPSGVVDLTGNGQQQQQQHHTMMSLGLPMVGSSSLVQTSGGTQITTGLTSPHHPYLMSTIQNASQPPMTMLAGSSVQDPQNYNNLYSVNPNNSSQMPSTMSVMAPMNSMGLSSSSAAPLNASTTGANEVTKPDRRAGVSKSGGTGGSNSRSSKSSASSRAERDRERQTSAAAGSALTGSSMTAATSSGGASGATGSTPGTVPSSSSGYNAPRNTSSTGNLGSATFPAGGDEVTGTSLSKRRELVLARLSGSLNASMERSQGYGGIQGPSFPPSNPSTIVPQGFRPEPVPFLPRPKSHWDFVLDEMQWMAVDFRQELRFKLTTAKAVAELCAEVAVDIGVGQTSDKLNSSDLLLDKFVPPVTSRVRQLLFNAHVERESCVAVRSVATKISSMIRVAWMNINRRSNLSSPLICTTGGSMWDREATLGTSMLTATALARPGYSKPLKKISSQNLLSNSLFIAASSSESDANKNFVTVFDRYFSKISQFRMQASEYALQCSESSSGGVEIGDMGAKKSPLSKTTKTKKTVSTSTFSDSQNSGSAVDDPIFASMTSHLHAQQVIAVRQIVSAGENKLGSILKGRAFIGKTITACAAMVSWIGQWKLNQDFVPANSAISEEISSLLKARQPISKFQNMVLLVVPRYCILRWWVELRKMWSEVDVRLLNVADFLSGNGETHQQVVFGEAVGNAHICLVVLEDIPAWLSINFTGNEGSDVLGNAQVDDFLWLRVGSLSGKGIFSFPWGGLVLDSRGLDVSSFTASFQTYFELPSCSKVRYLNTTLPAKASRGHGNNVARKLGGPLDPTVPGTGFDALSKRPVLHWFDIIVAGMSLSSRSLRLLIAEDSTMETFNNEINDENGLHTREDSVSGYRQSSLLAFLAPDFIESSKNVGASGSDGGESGLSSLLAQPFELLVGSTLQAFAEVVASLPSLVANIVDNLSFDLSMVVNPPGPRRVPTLDIVEEVVVAPLTPGQKKKYDLIVSGHLNEENLLPQTNFITLAQSFMLLRRVCFSADLVSVASANGGKSDGTHGSSGAPIDQVTGNSEVDTATRISGDRDAGYCPDRSYQLFPGPIGLNQNRYGLETNNQQQTASSLAFQSGKLQVLWKVLYQMGILLPTGATENPSLSIATVAPIAIVVSTQAELVIVRLYLTLLGIGSFLACDRAPSLTSPITPTGGPQCSLGSIVCTADKDKPSLTDNEGSTLQSVAGTAENIDSTVMDVEIVSDPSVAGQQTAELPATVRLAEKSRSNPTPAALDAHSFAPMEIYMQTMEDPIGDLQWIRNQLSIMEFSSGIDLNVSCFWSSITSLHPSKCRSNQPSVLLVTADAFKPPALLPDQIGTLIVLSDDWVYSTDYKSYFQEQVATSRSVGNQSPVSTKLGSLVSPISRRDLKIIRIVSEGTLEHQFAIHAVGNDGTKFDDYLKYLPPSCGISRLLSSPFHEALSKKLSSDTSKQSTPVEKPTVAPVMLDVAESKDDESQPNALDSQQAAPVTASIPAATTVQSKQSSKSQEVLSPADVFLMGVRTLCETLDLTSICISRQRLLYYQIRRFECIFQKSIGAIEIGPKLISGSLLTNEKSGLSPSKNSVSTSATVAAQNALDDVSAASTVKLTSNEVEPFNLTASLPSEGPSAPANSGGAKLKTFFPGFEFRSIDQFRNTIVDALVYGASPQQWKINVEKSPAVAGYGLRSSNLRSATITQAVGNWAAICPPTSNFPNSWYQNRQIFENTADARHVFSVREPWIVESVMERHLLEISSSGAAVIVQQSLINSPNAKSSKNISIPLLMRMAVINARVNLAEIIDKKSDLSPNGFGGDSSLTNMTNPVAEEKIICRSGTEVASDAFEQVLSSTQDEIPMDVDNRAINSIPPTLSDNTVTETIDIDTKNDREDDRLQLLVLAQVLLGPGQTIVSSADCFEAFQVALNESRRLGIAMDAHLYAHPLQSSNFQEMFVTPSWARNHMRTELPVAVRFGVYGPSTTTTGKSQRKHKLAARLENKKRVLGILPMPATNILVGGSESDQKRAKVINTQGVAAVSVGIPSIGTLGNTSTAPVLSTSSQPVVPQVHHSNFGANVIREKYAVAASRDVLKAIDSVPFSVHRSSTRIPKELDMTENPWTHLEDSAIIASKMVCEDKHFVLAEALVSLLGAQKNYRWSMGAGLGLMTTSRTRIVDSSVETGTVASFAIRSARQVAERYNILLASKQLYDDLMKSREVGIIQGILHSLKQFVWANEGSESNPQNYSKLSDYELSIAWADVVSSRGRNNLQFLVSTKGDSSVASKVSHEVISGSAVSTESAMNIDAGHNSSLTETLGLNIHESSLVAEVCEKEMQRMPEELVKFFEVVSDAEVRRGPQVALPGLPPPPPNAFAVRSADNTRLLDAPNAVHSSHFHAVSASRFFPSQSSFAEKSGVDPLAIVNAIHAHQVQQLQRQHSSHHAYPGHDSGSTHIVDSSQATRHQTLQQLPHPLHHNYPPVNRASGPMESTPSPSTLLGKSLDDSVVDNRSPLMPQQLLPPPPSSGASAQSSSMPTFSMLPQPATNYSITSGHSAPGASYSLPSGTNPMVPNRIGYAFPAPGIGPGLPQTGSVSNNLSSSIAPGSMPGSMPISGHMQSFESNAAAGLSNGSFTASPGTGSMMLPGAGISKSGFVAATGPYSQVYPGLASNQSTPLPPAGSSGNVAGVPPAVDPKIDMQRLLARRPEVKQQMKTILDNTELSEADRKIQMRNLVRQLKEDQANGEK